MQHKAGHSITEVQIGRTACGFCKAVKLIGKPQCRSVFAAVHAALPNDQQVVELVAVIAVYNMVARVLVALQVEPE